MTPKKTITMYACFPHWFKIWKTTTTTAITDVFYKGKLRCLLMLAWLLSIIQRGNVFNAGGKVIALHFKETIRELLNAWADQCTFGNVFQLSSSGDPAIWFPLTMVIKLYSKLEARESENNDMPCFWCTLFHLMLSVKILIVSLWADTFDTLQIFLILTIWRDFQGLHNVSP